MDGIIREKKIRSLLVLQDSITCVLCPCFWLTFRERDKVIRALQYPSEGFTLKKPLTLLVDKHGQASLQHSCAVDTFVDGELVVTTSIKMNLTLCGHGFFRAETEYLSKYRTERRIEKEAEPIFICPHEDLFTCNSWGHCGKCYSYFNSSQSGYNRKPPIFMNVQRILGPVDWRNDCVWSRNCRHMFYDSMSWHYFWYVCIREHWCEIVCANFGQSSPGE